MCVVQSSYTTMLLYIYCNFITIQSFIISKYVQCIDVIGSNPSGNPLESFESVAPCPSTYIVTSCGAKRIGDNEIVQGTMIEYNKCTTLSELKVQSGYGIRAYARCCNLTDYGSSFKYRISSRSGTFDDDQTTRTCATNEQLIGCGGSVYFFGDNGEHIDGSFVELSSHIGNTAQTFPILLNQCTAQNGNIGNGVLADATCYDTSTINNGYVLNCVSVWGQASNTGMHISTVSCPVDEHNYFMTSCTAYSPFAAMQGYVIVNNACIVTDKLTNDYVYANAICCTMFKNITSPPTFTGNPTQNPTMDPTKYPTKYPSKSPSKYPTIHPTKYPTKYMYATNNPTMYPLVINEGEVVLVTAVQSTLVIKESMPENNMNMLLLIIYIVVGVILCGLSICIVVLVYRRINQHKQFKTDIEMGKVNSTLTFGENNVVTPNCSSQFYQNGEVCAVGNQIVNKVENEEIDSNSVDDIDDIDDMFVNTEFAQETQKETATGGTDCGRV